MLKVYIGNKVRLTKLDFLIIDRNHDFNLIISLKRVKKPALYNAAPPIALIAIDLELDLELEFPLNKP
jgi:hypothetical protein